MPPEPIIPLFATITSTLLFIVSAHLIILFFLYKLGVRQRFRISSTPYDGLCRPIIYTFTKDVVAVHGWGGKRLREEWNTRYECSPLFREMLNRLDAFWGFGTVTVAGAIATVVWTIPVVYHTIWLLDW